MKRRDDPILPSLPRGYFWRIVRDSTGALKIEIRRRVPIGERIVDVWFRNVGWTPSMREAEKYFITPAEPDIYADALELKRGWEQRREEARVRDRWLGDYWVRD